MSDGFHLKPIKELVTGWDWIKAFHDFSYPNCSEDNVDEIKDWIKNYTHLQHSKIKEGSPSSHIEKQEEWVNFARRDIQRVYGTPENRSLDQLLSRPPDLEELPIGSYLHKLILFGSIVLDPLDFLKALASEDKELSELLKLNNTEGQKLTISKGKSLFRGLEQDELSGLRQCFKSGTKNRSVLEKYISSYGECVRYDDLQNEIWGKPYLKDDKRPFHNAEKASAEVNSEINPKGFKLEKHVSNMKTVGRKMIRL